MYQFNSWQGLNGNIILVNAIESAHTPRLVDWTENMAATERAANIRKWGMSNSLATNAVRKNHSNSVVVGEHTTKLVLVYKKSI